MAALPDYSAHYRDRTVAVFQGAAAYPAVAPYHPSVAYPEYDASLGLAAEPNAAYEAVRSALHLLGLDDARFGQSTWNPLGEVITPGDTVVLKPNFVLSDHYRGGNVYAVITHPSVLRAVVDYAFRAIRGEGKIIIADTPQMDCDFAQLLERTKLPALQDLYWKNYRFEVAVVDLRDFWFKYEDENYLASQERRQKLPGDPLGSVVVDLGRRSAFDGIRPDRFYGADFNRAETVAHHSGGKQEYCISRTMLSADVLISIPKLKVHKKVGVTLNAKGLVGTVTNKNYLVHYTLGSPEHGGDQFPSGVLDGKGKAIVAVQRFLYDLLLTRRSLTGSRVFQAFYLPYRKFLKPLLKRTTDTIVLYDGGNWYGNDSAWRMVSDLMKILHYADKEGVMRETPQRKIFSVVDGIIGGEGNGPLFPDAREVGVVLAGRNPLAVDLTAVRLMGFHWKALRWVHDLLENPHVDFFLRSPEEVDVRSNVEVYRTMFTTSERLLAFRPHPGWVGHLELR